MITFLGLLTLQQHAHRGSILPSSSFQTICIKHYSLLHSVRLGLLSSRDLGPQRLLPYFSAKKVALSTACSAICFIDLFAPRLILSILSLLQSKSQDRTVLPKEVRIHGRTQWLLSDMSRTLFSFRATIKDGHLHPPGNGPPVAFSTSWTPIKCQIDLSTAD